MTQLQTHARLGLLMSALALMSVPSAALAQEAACETDADCEHGYTCEAVGGGCPAIACAPGSECPPQECETTLGCVPARDCEADSDCATGWKCATEQYSECSDSRGAEECLPGEECVKPEVPPAPDCETKEVSFCAPPWTLPCEEAADCGAGFECVERIAMSCSGSSGGGSAGEPTPTPGDDPADSGGSAGAPGFAPPAEGDPVPPDEEMPGECTSEPSGEFYCQLIETPCAADADCAAGLTCQEQYGDSVSCGGATPDVPPEEGSGSGGGSGGADPDQDRALPADCVAPEPTYACAPPGFNSGYGYDYGRGEATSGGGVTPDQGGGTGNPNDENGGEEPPTSPTDDDAELSGSDGDTADMMSESSGCSTTGSSRSSSGMMLMGLAVLGLALRRRAIGA